MIRTGDSLVVSSSPNSYAIIPKGKQLLLNMEDINKQLLDINTQITKKIKVSEPIYNKTNQETYLKNKELIDTYEKLLDERKTIVEILNQYESLDNAENENQIKTTKHYYTYILLSILVIAIIIILYRMSGSGTSTVTPIIQSGGDLGPSAYYIVFGLIIFVIILRFVINYLSI
jgi:NADH:ubiquinone oxidoreductase subunit 3 (subunit A)